MKKRRKRLPLLFKISLPIFIASLILLLAARRVSGFAELLNSTVSHDFRRFTATIGNLFDFSLFEAIILSLPLILILIVFILVRSVKKGKGILRPTANIVAVALLLYSGNALALGVAYNGVPIADKMELASVEIDADSLELTARALIEELNATAPQVSRDDGGIARMDGGLEELSVKICDSYASLAEEHGFNKGFYSTAKSVNALNILSRLGITGIYTYYTGEANVNTDYPDYDIAFTAAHELSHQRGILPENEANFSAYLICSSSDDIFLRYSGALYMYEYIASALYRADPERYAAVASDLTELVRPDIAASRAVTEKYGDGLLRDISHFVNDLFLKSNGTAGTVTYGMVVELAVAYITDRE